MNTSRKIFSAAVWTTLLNIVNAIYGFVSVPLLINYFGKANYGLIGLAMSINVYLQLMDMGFNNTNIRFFSAWLAENKNNKVLNAFRTSLSFYGVIGLINAIILIVVAIFVQSIFNVDADQSVILRNLLFILAVTALCSWFSSCFDQIIKATENVAWIQKRTLVTKILMIFVLFATIYFKLNIELYYALTCLATLSIVPFSINKIKKDLPFTKFSPSFDKDVFGEMLPYCLNIFSFSIFQFTFYHLRPVFLGMQGSIESVADFRILNGVTGLVQMLGGAFVGVLLPSTSKIVAEKNMKAYYQVAYDGTKYISMIKCFCCFGLMSIGPELITLYVGDKYLYLTPWLNLWLICLLGTHNQAISSLIFASADVRAISYSSALASIVGLIITWFLIPYYQIGGAVIGLLVYVVIQFLFYYLYYWPNKMHINSLRVFIKSFLPCVCIGLISWCICKELSLEMNIWIKILVVGLTFIIIYGILSMIVLNKEDYLFFKRILKK